MVRSGVITIRAGESSGNMAWSLGDEGRKSGPDSLKCNEEAKLLKVADLGWNRVNEAVGEAGSPNTC